MNISIPLQMAMHRKKLTPEKLAEQSGVSLSTIYKMRLGWEDYNMSVLQALFEVLQLELQVVSKKDTAADLSEDQLRRINNFLTRNY
jgi:predicted transcriptional regulator